MKTKGYQDTEETVKTEARPERVKTKTRPVNEKRKGYYSRSIFHPLNFNISRTNKSRCCDEFSSCYF
ncbi:hypothetical protein EYF80_024705 [Liparis tanakae]|uniref:Uncharacterized protein n=1 Tax=Liparis tanakae TaxID=230148 RepID=A0A4Z2HH64_9TELE|nr:hypothetical protein EYF80_024705 [Liparis tanakae]